MLLMLKMKAHLSLKLHYQILPTHQYERGDVVRTIRLNYDSQINYSNVYQAQNIVPTSTKNGDTRLPNVVSFFVVSCSHINLYWNDIVFLIGCMLDIVLSVLVDRITNDCENISDSSSSDADDDDFHQWKLINRGELISAILWLLASIVHGV